MALPTEHLHGGCQSIPACSDGCCLQAAYGQPPSSWREAAVTFTGYTIVYKYGRHSQKIRCCFPQVRALEGIFGSITTRTNPQVDLHFVKPYFQRQEERRPSFRVQSWGVACPALGKESLHLSCSVLSWENKQSTGRCYSGGLCESCGLQQSCCKVLG